jgi:hypothetical protein
MGVEDVDQMGQRSGQPVLVAGEARLGPGIPGLGGSDDGRSVLALAAVGRVVQGKAGPGEPGLDAAMPAAIAGRTGTLLIQRRRKRIVSPLAGDRIRARQKPAADDDPAADPGAQDGAEDDGQARARAIGRFRDREAVASLARRKGRPRTRLRSSLKGRPLSHVELAFFTSPVVGEIAPGMPTPTTPGPPPAWRSVSAIISAMVAKVAS